MLHRLGEPADLLQVYRPAHPQLEDCETLHLRDAVGHSAGDDQAGLPLPFSSDTRGNFQPGEQRLPPFCQLYFLFFRPGKPDKPAALPLVIQERGALPLWKLHHAGGIQQPWAHFGQHRRGDLPGEGKAFPQETGAVLGHSGGQQGELQLLRQRTQVCGRRILLPHQKKEDPSTTAQIADPAQNAGGGRRQNAESPRSGDRCAKGPVNGLLRAGATGFLKQIQKGGSLLTPLPKNKTHLALRCLGESFPPGFPFFHRDHPPYFLRCMATKNGAEGWLSSR